MEIKVIRLLYFGASFSLSQTFSMQTSSITFDWYHFLGNTRNFKILKMRNSFLNE